MTYKSKLFISFSILLVIGATTASAQLVFRRGGGDTVRQTPPAPRMETGVDRNAISGTVTGTIRWSKAIGLPPMYPGASEPYAVPCGLIVILAKKTVGHNGSFGQFEVVGRGNSYPVESGIAGPGLGKHYACSYTVKGLPKDTSLLMTAEFIDTRTFDTEPWLSVYTVGGRTAPPAGSTRVFKGGGSVMLTNDRPVGEINFGIGYARAADMPR